MARAAAWLAFYTAATVVCTWPLGAHLATHLPDTVGICRNDLRLIVWALSWQTHALATAPTHFFDANVYHPTPHALLYSEAGYGALPFFLPTMLSTGNPVLAANLMFLGSIALTAWGVHLLVARATAMDAAGFVAAGTLLTSRWLLRFWGPAAPNYVVLQYFPAIIALGASPRLTGRYAVVLALLIALQAVVSPYVAAAVVTTLAVLAAWRCVRPRERAAAWPLGIAVVGGAVVAGSVYLPNLALRSVEPNLAKQSVWRWIVPGPLGGPQQWFLDPISPTAIALPLLLLVMLSLGLRLAGRGSGPPEGKVLWRHGWLWTGVGLALMASRGVIVAGHAVVWPAAPLLGSLPGLDLFRVPPRLGVGAFLGLAVLAGVAFADATGWIARSCRRSLQPALRAGLALALVVASAAPFASPVMPGSMAARFLPLLVPWGSFAVRDSRGPDSPPRAALRGLARPLVVLDYSVTNGLARIESHAQAMFETIGDWYPLVNGYGGYYPIEFPKRMALAYKLPNPAALARLRETTGLGLVLVRGGMDGERMARWRDLARRGSGDGLRLVAESERELLFAVEP